jgi:serine/threonine-protein kinase
MVDDGGRVRLLDFGIAKEVADEEAEDQLTLLEERPMTPLYASPEQLCGDQISTLSDQYQLGLVLFELITGQCHHLLDGNDPRSILQRANLLETPKPSTVLASRTTVTGRRSEETIERIAQFRRSTLKELVLDVRGDLDWIVLKALAKRPEDRYASVAALVDDLERLLGGRPIGARPASPGYQLRKWVGRHRAQTGLAAALVLALGGFWAVSEIQARRSERLRTFSQRVEREAEQIERLLHDASLQPLHDMSAERRAVASRIAALERERQDPLLGSAAAYGVGRGLLALGETERAAAALQASWDGGFRGDGIRYSLGSALGALHRQRMSAARAIDDEALREARVREAEVGFRDRALEHLNAIENEERAELRSALIAFHQGDHDGALGRVRRIRSDYPWQHEALAMEAEILTERAQQRYLLGQVEAARADLDRAGELLNEALEIGRSDADLYLRQCDRGYTLIQMSGDAGLELPPIVAAARRSCEQASKVRPEWAEPYVYLANLYLSWWDVGRSQTPELLPVIEPMRRAAERALKLDSEHAVAHHRLGLALYMEGRQLSVDGDDPLPTFDRAIESLERAVELDPGYPYSYNGLALTANNCADWLVRRGRDPAAYLDRGRVNARRAVELMPTWHNSRSNLAQNLATRGDWEGLSGGGPFIHYQAALAEMDRVLETNPGFVRARRMRAVFLQDLIATRLERGLEAEAELDELNRDVGLLMEALPDDVLVVLSAARAALFDAWRDPNDPTALARGRQIAERGERDYPGHLLLPALSIELLLEEARSNHARGRSPEPALRRSEGVRDRLERSTPWDSLLAKAVASVYRSRAAWQLLNGSNSDAEVEAGIAAAERGLEWNGLHWGSAAERAALTLVSAVQRGGDAGLLDDARRELRDILSANASVAPAVRPLAEIADGVEDGSLSRRQASSRLLLYRSSLPRR